MKKLILVTALSLTQTSTVKAELILSAFGTITTLTSGQNDIMYIVGWAFIIGGTVGGARAQAEDLNDINSEAKIYIPSQVGNSPQTLRANVADVLRVAEMDAMVATRTPQLATGLRIAEFATSMGVTPERLGHLVISGKTLADSRLQGQKFAARITKVSADDVMGVSGPISETELEVVGNYLKLRNIEVE